MDPKKREQEFLAKLLETFKIEAEEHLKTISDGLLALERNDQQSDKAAVIETIYREAHSLKGAARAVNHSTIQEITQAFESVLSAYKEDRISSNPHFFDVLLHALEVIKKFTHQTAAILSKEDETILQHTCQSLNDLLQVNPNPPTEKIKELDIPAPPSLFQKEQPSTTIRVSTQKLDLLLQEVEELLLLKLSASKTAALLSTLQEHNKEWEKIKIRSEELLSEDSKLSSVAHKTLKENIANQNKCLESVFEIINICIKATSQDARLSASLVDNLLDNTKTLLLQPFSILLESFPLMVREISHSLDKEIKLELMGGEIELDRRILEELKDPLMHLIRNSIDHGIETPEERIEAKKSPEGILRIQAEQISGNQVQITLSDDGRGMNIQKLKQAALKEGVISEQDAELMSDQEAINLAFQSGVSTSPTITELSGRGLGMKIVAEKVEKMGGRLTITTEKNKGTIFQILVPITLGTFRGIQVNTFGHDFIIPTSHIVRVLQLEQGDIKSVEGHETLYLDGQTLLYRNLGELIGVSPKDINNQSNANFCLIIKAADSKLIIGVDFILSEQELFIKSFGKLLPKVKFFSAATIFENGNVIPIIDPFDLIAEAKHHSKTKPIQQNLKPPKKQSTILVAEDSITARILLKNILTSAGFIVKTAVNGLEALDVLMNEQIDLLMTDIEMPQMDGFELAEKVRSVEKLKNIPIIICTSKSSRFDREHGIKIGANAYIDKGSFMQSSLLDIIQKLL